MDTHKITPAPQVRFHVRWDRILGAIALGLTLATLPCYALVQETPCATEDDTWCHWDAQRQGNGSGHSFTTYWEGFTVSE